MNSLLSKTIVIIVSDVIICRSNNNLAEHILSEKREKVVMLWSLKYMHIYLAV